MGQEGTNVPSVWLPYVAGVAVRLISLFVLLLEWVWSGGVDSEERIQNQDMEHGYKITY